MINRIFHINASKFPFLCVTLLLATFQVGAGTTTTALEVEELPDGASTLQRLMGSRLAVCLRGGIRFHQGQLLAVLKHSLLFQRAGMATGWNRPRAVIG